MARLLDVFIEVLEQHSLRFARVEGEEAVLLEFDGHHGNWTCYVREYEAQEQMVLYSIYPRLIAEERRPDMAEFIARANYDLVIGNLEIDFDDGEVRYKTSIDLPAPLEHKELLKPLLVANATLIDRYWPGIAAVESGRLSPREAIAEVEGADGSS